ncbi:MAG: glycogen synthase GlgA [Candidatus Omnitrophota bacterium]
MKVVICASEVVPFAKTGGLADVAGALPIALEDVGQEVVIVMPKYKMIQDSKFNIQRLKQGISCTTVGRNIKVYFIENSRYFEREGLYGDKQGDYPDNLERFSYYSRRTLELLKELNFRPDVIHVHDWQACLIPAYLKNNYRQEEFYKDTRVLLTIHNIGYQGIFSKDEYPKLGLDWGLFNMEMLEFYDKINLLKGGIVFSDTVNTVSPTYSREIQTKEFGFGLEGILAKRRNELFGVLNGLDYSIWNPATDKFISQNYSARTVNDKLKNKEDLQRFSKLPVDAKVPLFGIVSRLAEQKGFDILSEAIDKICKRKLELVILGTGDQKYHELLGDIVRKYPEVVSLYLKFDNTLAHKIYAGSDIFLMPSKYEPCGLGQMISLSYGTIPLVFKTGGLADTVSDANGFVFDQYSPSALEAIIDKSIRSFSDKKKWGPLVKKAMQYNFSWEVSARQYLKLYKR